jgi:mercuric reductase
VSHDPRGLVKVVVSRDSRQLLGVHIVAAEAGEMIQEASMAMRFGIGVDELAAALHPYLTYSEAMKLACQSLEKDVAKLSCCAA